ncbi:UNKNOWN [Stylonychia lemnae]|uniref:Uncharacterized protein n=1 Tax=Stylonychia lemnae TaxID=5949 RepID=A0A078AST3_STYLE|nr:UNKNOWN [Stylonychia lemnae]|eukprot:CDW85249.1 UNKNOWN [Stylonychia lemnae]
MAAFNDTLGPDCKNLFHNPYACMGSTTDQAPDGPFSTAQWSVFVLPDHIGAMATLVMQHRKSHSMLIHPNSGCEIEDHSNWTLWGGQLWSLDRTTLHKDKSFPWDNAKDLILFGAALAHPTYYKVDRNTTCISPTPAQIYSYHIHLLYFQNNKENTVGAFQIRDQFAAAFNQTLGPDCHDLFHNDNSCILDDDKGPAGPFPTAQWSVFVLPEHIGSMSTWMMQHRQDYSILVHTNSGCEIEDHSNWTLWGGEPWTLDLTIFSHDKPFPWRQVKETRNGFLLE